MKQRWKKLVKRTAAVLIAVTVTAGGILSNTALAAEFSNGEPGTRLITGIDGSITVVGDAEGEVSPDETEISSGETNDAESTEPDSGTSEAESESGGTGDAEDSDGEQALETEEDSSQELPEEEISEDEISNEEISEEDFSDEEVSGEIADFTEDDEKFDGDIDAESETEKTTAEEAVVTRAEIMALGAESGPGFSYLLRGFNAFSGKELLAKNLGLPTISTEGKSSLTAKGLYNADIYDPYTEYKTDYFSAKSVSELFESMNVKTQLELSAKVSAGFIIKSSLETKLKASTSSSTSFASSYESWFTQMRVYKGLGKNRLNDNPEYYLRENGDDFWSALNPAFKDALLNGDVSALFTNYGTHLLTAYEIGAVAEYTMSLVNTSSTYDKTVSAAVDAAINASVKGFGVVNVEADANSSIYTAFQNHSRKTGSTITVSAEAHGGRYAPPGIEEMLKNGNGVPNFSSWLNSVNADDLGSAEILLTDNLELIGIWEIIPDTYADRRNEIRQFYLAEAIKSHNSFYEKYMRSTVAVESAFDKPNIDNFIKISTDSELAKIGKSSDYPLSGNYILLNDIDLSKFGDWTPISPFTGTFDGNGNAVSGVTVSAAGYVNPGLFGVVTGTIKNLAVSYRSRFGGVAGDSSNAKGIINCYARYEYEGVSTAELVSKYGFKKYSSSQSSITDPYVIFDGKTSQSTLNVGAGVKVIILRGLSASYPTNLVINGDADVVLENSTCKSYNVLTNVSNGAIAFNGSGSPALISVGKTNTVTAGYNVSGITAKGNLYICGTGDLKVANTLVAGGYGLSVSGNLEIALSAKLSATGGNGSTSSGNGNEGGTGIRAASIKILNNSAVTAIGGQGGDGDGTIFNSKNGGNSGVPLSILSGTKLVISPNAFVELISERPGYRYGSWFGSGSDGSYPSFGAYQSVASIIGTRKIAVIGSSTNFGTASSKWINGRLIVEKLGNLVYSPGQAFDLSGFTFNFVKSGLFDAPITLGKSSVRALYDFGTIGGSVTPKNRLVTLTYDYDGKRYVRYIPVTIVAPQTVGDPKFTEPSKKTFLVNDPFDYGGITLEQSYSDGSITLITNGFSVVPPADVTATVGEKTITVTHPSYPEQWTYNINVVADAVVGIVLKNDPYKKSYFKGETFASAGMTFTITYISGQTDVISDSSVNFSHGVLDTVSPAFPVTFSYGNGSNIVSGNIPYYAEVKDDPLTLFAGINPTKMNYFVGEYFDLSGITVYAEGQNSRNSVLLTAADITVRPNRPLYQDDVSVTLQYVKNGVVLAARELTGITVSPVVPSGIKITANPAKTEYNENENFDKTGMKVSLLYNNGISEVVTNYTVSPVKLSASDTFVTVTYNGFSENVGVTVKGKTVTKLEVDAKPNKIKYFTGENFDSAGLSVKATYNDGSTESNVSFVVISPTSAFELGDTEAIVSYMGAVATINVTVIERSKVETPVAAPGEGMVTAGSVVTFTCPTDGAEIWYSVNGGTNTKYNPASPPKINADSTVKVWAVKAGMEDSAPATFTYTVAKAGTTVVKINNVTITAGQTRVQIVVSTENVKRIGGFSFYINYNPEKLTFVTGSGKRGSTISDWSNFVAEEREPGVLAVHAVNMDMTGAGTTTDGNLVVAEFDIINGKADDVIPLTFKDFAFFDIDGSSVVCASQSGSITGIRYGYVLGGTDITVGDALRAFRGAAGLVTLTPEEYAAASLGDAELNVGHALRIFRFAAGLSKVL